MEQVRCLSRALELARETSDEARQGKVMTRMTALAQNDLASENGGPGISLGMLRPLVALPVQERPAGLDDLLQRVESTYGADPYIVDSVVDLRVRLLSEDKRRELRREQVRRWREEAKKGDGMLRVARLEQALEIARSYGLKEEAEEIRRELGSISPQELGLQRITTELQIPAEQVEQFLEGFEKAESWQDALQMLAAERPPGGSPEELGDHVDQLMRDFPVQYLFTKALIGPDNATAVFRAATPEQHKRLALAEERAQQARIWGIFCARALDRIGQREDRPTRDLLVEFFTSDFIEEEVAERLARAVELYWDDQFDESAHVLVPRLERVIREMARQIGVPIVREPRPGKEIGGVEMLGGLLRDLETGFADPGWHAYLLNLLADPLGLNLRNSITHGLHGTVGPTDAALLIQAALLLNSLSLRPVKDPPTPPAGASPA